MKDSEVRGIILKTLYGVRHMNNGMMSLPDGMNDPSIPPAVLGNCAAQLDEQGLIKFRQLMGRSYPSGMASITAYGVDVIEGTTRPAIAVTVDSSINVSGSQGVQIGGQGNTQNLSFDIEKMISVIDSAGASLTEKEEAKSLLKRLFDNKLVQAALQTALKTWTGASAS
jgi:hypothetical protein